ncbi:MULTISPECIES: carbon-nitrogen hydrolase family protein [unclassified Ruegeria]|uniref:carbon-nitrogen hydrolase family protein n=1 Tax=unclassified Ruegeria TaxID=2625375 RepID=UPI0014881B6E|nr:MULTISPECIES: carbon-nitrogen hydrolase family protein [unclassified Ruegeria]NOD35661.1 carbon-nitrogen hydrolase family protein [Ruegeria sp. HKCCD7296]NOD47189.1 carbon-nitrogen hydrolase family protein [Ruegeria sp. HKCCD5849]NOD51512.1 carbon-nitrogen hydrolase family protein [Ruegeria sp. HKCCD5851]NOD69343.1 carbon-nitrogen hydrolase family protein [Ruegeria sp. HKCCD7303]NOE43028.1 carbon-nitrogen hydrolase family protein [Ruegeria sp. HKCCD7319]
MTSSDTLSLLACQIEIPATKSAAARDRHLAESAAKVRDQLSRRNVDLVVLPELSSIDYARSAFDRLNEIAEPLEGASFEKWREVAKEFGVHVTYSFARRGALGTHISIAVVNPDGALTGYYDKLHLCQYGASMEKEYFDAGDHIFTFKINGITISPIICYDIRIPELARTLTLRHDVDLILHCGAYYRDESFETWHNFAMARAMENQIFFLSLNRAGETWGNSIFCWPWMDENILPVRFAETAEDFRHVTINKGQLLQARKDYTFLKDRLADYDAL